jgi:hypothetical protein
MSPHVCQSQAGEKSVYSQSAIVAVSNLCARGIILEMPGMPVTLLRTTNLGVCLPTETRELPLANLLQDGHDLK